MTIPLIALASLALVGGLVGVPIGRLNAFEHWLHPTVAYRGASLAEIQAARAASAQRDARPAPVVLRASDPHPAEPGREEISPRGALEGGHGGGVEAEAHVPPIAEGGLMVLATLIALAGIGLARQMYVNRPELPASVASRAGALYRLVAGKYYVDELYDWMILRPFSMLCNLFRWIDQWMVDGAVNGVRHMTMGLSHASNFNDRWVVDLAVNGAGALVRGSSFVLRRAQTGIVQNYAAAMILGSFLLLGIYLVFS